MTSDEITAKKQEVNDRFTELMQQKTEVEAELNRLQGEFRLLQRLEEGDPATTIVADEKKAKNAA